METIVGKTAGFCYGVKRAIENTKKQLEKEKKIYCLGEIVHNSVVINDLKEKGIEFIEDIKEAKGKTIIRAHGVEKKIYEYATKNNIDIEDYTCPKVVMIHEKVNKYSKQGYYILLCGSKTHPENIGTISYCNNQCSNIEKEEDIELALNEAYKSKLNKIVLISQTTYSLKMFEQIEQTIKEKLDVNYELIIENTICKATQIRQNETEELSKIVDMMIIIGGKNSSNTKKLYNISKVNIENSICIEDILEIDGDIEEKILNSDKIGIMAGASTPDISIQEVVKNIKKLKTKNKNILN